MVSTVNLLAIDEETPRIDIGCSLKKEFTELIYMMQDAVVKTLVPDQWDGVMENYFKT